MSVSYDVFTEAFLDKVVDYGIVNGLYDSEELIYRYMKRAISEFRKSCRHDLSTTADDASRTFNVDIPEADLVEITDIISDGMVVHWLKPYVYKQENLENVLNTRDFTTYSPSELLFRICGAHKQAQSSFTNKVREYSFNHGDLTTLHL